MSSEVDTRDFREQIRKRPAMWFGSSDSLGVLAAVNELVSNGLDLYLQGTASRLGVSTSDDAIVYSDDEPGLPYDLPGSTGASRAEDYLTTFRDTATADDHAPHLHLSGWGCGLAAVSAVSEVFEVETWRSGRLWVQRFRQGTPVEPPRALESGTGRGTRIRFRPDAAVFSVRRPHRLRFRKMMFEAAHLIPGIVIRCEEEVFHAPEGLAELAHLHFARESAFSPLVEPHFSCQVNDDSIRIHVGLIGTAAAETRFRSWANGAETLAHGTHLDGLRDALRGAKIEPSVAMIHVIMNRPEFAGPTRGQLRNPEVREKVREALEPTLRKWAEERRVS